MTNEQFLKNLSVPNGKIDIVIDTDTFNEVDDQFAVSYLIRSTEKLNTKAIYAAPFFNPHSNSPEDGMLKSYDEIYKILKLLDESKPVFMGARNYLIDENTPVISPASEDLAKRANDYSPENPLYVVAIGAITNVASAILINPKMIENTVVVWLGGHAHHYHDTKEFNMRQDVAAARVVMGSGVPFIQLPCRGVVSAFTVTKQDLEYWFVGKNKLTDYLAKNAIEEMDDFEGFKGHPWSRCIWDVTAVGWLLNDNNRFMFSRQINTKLPTYDNLYEETPIKNLSTYVYHINRDVLLEDLIKKLT